MSVEGGMTRVTCQGPVDDNNGDESWGARLKTIAETQTRIAAVSGAIPTTPLIIGDIVTSPNVKLKVSCGHLRSKCKHS